MTTIMTVDRSGAALPCAPATVVPHEVAHAAIPASRKFGLRRRASALRVAVTPLRAWGEVSPIPAAFVDDHKCTGASVPGRRGGT
ncbi:hypothetical protein H7X46_04245 [Pseudonocardia sp. C8]|uniref:hypothetical protein n=1 Tax=Pseudonocardia sp. C8 TaxID=2762759 RepID=UPI00164358C9|nr:hypothetical protein [Pseudonocardia sp. C8]MBC3190272.1 hypothetical protein [Pseudonocardia sp. C8]